MERDHLQQQPFTHICRNQLDPVGGDFFFSPISISIWEALSMPYHPSPKLLEFNLPPPCNLFSKEMDKLSNGMGFRKLKSAEDLRVDESLPFPCCCIG